jgi:hypothetical protein
MRSAAVAALLVAAAAGAWLRPHNLDPVPVSGAARANASEVSLIATVRRQQARIDELTGRLSLLEERLRMLSRAGNDELETQSAPSREVVIRGFRRVDPGALREAGLSDADAAALTRLVNDVYAAHEREQARFASEDQEVSESLKDRITRQFGPRIYDAYLYATGQRNRVVVARVAAGSAAEAAGIRLGDVLLALDGRIVRNGHDLQTITSAEGASEIALEVASAGGRIRALVPRGELGIVTRPERIRPDQSD